jgi:hypothetical protein
MLPPAETEWGRILQYHRFSDREITHTDVGPSPGAHFSYAESAD